jgi:hypothetical protein
MRIEIAPVTSVTSVTGFSLNRFTRARAETYNAEGRHARHACHFLTVQPTCRTFAKPQVWQVWQPICLVPGARNGR